MHQGHTFIPARDDHLLAQDKTRRFAPLECTVDLGTIFERGGVVDADNVPSLRRRALTWLQHLVLQPTLGGDWALLDFWGAVRRRGSILDFGTTPT